MRITLLQLVLIAILASSCSERGSLPADARQAIPVTIERFDRDFFALDTLNLNDGLNGLAEKYPDFFPGFLTAILGINPADPMAPAAVKAFLNTYATVYLQAQPVAEKHLPGLASQMEEALQWMRHLVNDFRPDSPFVITTFIGPMDAYESFSVGDYGDVRTADGVGIALQLHLGAENELYMQGMESGIFYFYQVRRFEPQTMLVNAVKNIVDDHFPYTATGKPLVEEMVEKGKRIYLLKKLLPHVPDSLLLGYTGEQVKGCLENESAIWQFFVKNDLLFSIEASTNQQYVRDGPKTQELGEASPGYIALFTGWRIVESYMEKKRDTSIDSLFSTPAATIFQGSGYRPR